MDLTELLKALFELFIKKPEETKVDEFNFNDLKDVIKNMISKKYGTFRNNDLLEDLISQIFINIILSMKMSIEKDSSFWNKLRCEGSNKNKVNSYIYKIIRTSYNETTKRESNKEEINLYKRVSSVCEELLEEGYLKTEGSFYFISKYLNENLPIFNNNSIGETEYDSIRNSKDGTINNTKLVSLVKYIFENKLEKSKIDLSNLVDLIKNIANLGIDSLISINSQDDESCEKSNIEIIDESNDPFLIKDDNYYFDKWERRLLNCYNNDLAELKTDIDYVYSRFIENKTLKTITESSELKKSAINNHINKFFRACRFDKEFDNYNPDLTIYVEKFLEYLNNKNIL